MNRHILLCEKHEACREGSFCDIWSTKQCRECSICFSQRFLVCKESRCSRFGTTKVTHTELRIITEHQTISSQDNGQEIDYIEYRGAFFGMLILSVTLTLFIAFQKRKLIKECFETCWGKHNNKRSVLHDIPEDNKSGPKDNVRSISCQTRQIDLTEDNKHIINEEELFNCLDEEEVIHIRSDSYETTSGNNSPPINRPANIVAYFNTQQVDENSIMPMPRISFGTINVDSHGPPAISYSDGLESSIIGTEICGDPPDQEINISRDQRCPSSSMTSGSDQSQILSSSTYSQPSKLSEVL